MAEGPRRYAAAAFRQLLGGDEVAVARALETGLAEVDGGEIVVANPRLLDVALDALAEFSPPPRAVVDITAEIKDAMDHLARRCRFRAGRFRHRLGPRGLHLRRSEPARFSGGQDDDHPARVGDPADLFADTRPAGHDRRGGRCLVRWPLHPGARRIRAAGDRGLARRPLRPAPRP